MITRFGFYPTRQYTDEPEIELIANCFLYDDNLTLEENAQAVYNYPYAENIKRKLEYYPTTETTPFKRLYCKELKYYIAGTLLVDYQLIWEQQNVSIEDFPGTKLIGVNFTTSSSHHIYTYTNTGYEFNLISGYASNKQYDYNATDCMNWIDFNPSNCVSYIKILYSYDENDQPCVRCIITGFEGYEFGTTNRVVRYETHSSDLSRYDIVIELEDEGDDDMKIKTPKLVELFNRQYLCTKSQIVALAQYIANYPNHQSLIDKIQILLGIDFSDWLESVVDLQIFPLNLTDHVAHNNTPQESVRFAPVAFSDDVGGQYITFSPGVYKVTERDCLFDATPWIPVTRRFDDFRDYPPYCSSQIYLPFIGIVDVDLSLYYGKYMKIKYSVDISSGGCRAFVCVSDDGSLQNDGHIIGQYDGAMGVHCPITKIEWSDYYNSIASGYAATVSSSLSAGASLAGTTGINSQIKNKNIDYIKRETNAGRNINQSGLQQYQSYDITSLATPLQMGRELNVAESRVPAMTTGSASGYLNECCDYDCYMIWYYVDTEETANLQALKGYVSDKSGTLSEFTGYLECSDVKLVCPKATENEKTRLVQLLTSGIYI